jgi:hypothetical protein
VVINAGTDKVHRCLNWPRIYQRLRTDTDFFRTDTDFFRTDLISPASTIIDFLPDLLTGRANQFLPSLPFAPFLGLPFLRHWMNSAIFGLVSYLDETAESLTLISGAS